MSVRGNVPVTCADEYSVQGHNRKVSNGAGAADVGRSQRYMSKNKSKKNRNREKQNTKTEAKKKTKTTKHSGRELRSSAMEGREHRRTKEARESLRNGVARTLHISRDEADADDRNLRLFK